MVRKVGPTRRVIRRRPISFVPLAGNGQIAKHSLLFRVGATKILFDPGINNGNGIRRKINDLNGLKYIVLTHAHLDHVGALVNVMQLYPRAKVFATAPTRALAAHLLDKRNDIDEGVIKRCVSKIEAVDYDDEIELERQVRITFIPAGHILGSAAIVVTTPEGNFLFTGDFTTEDRGVLAPFRPPNLDFRAVIAEGSYVGMKMPTVLRERDRFFKEVEDVVGEGRNSVIATDPLGVFQEYALLMGVRQLLKLFPHFQIFINDRLRSTFEIYLEHYADFAFSAVDIDALRGRFVGLNPLSEGGYSPELAPFCYFAGPSNLKMEFPRAFARQVLREGGQLFTDGMLTERKIIKRLGKQRSRPVTPEQISVLRFGNHIREADLLSLVEEMRPGHTVLLHGAFRKLQRFARGLPREATVSRVGEEIRL